jgi:hypothetical protein
LFCKQIGKRTDAGHDDERVPEAASRHQQTGDLRAGFLPEAGHGLPAGGRVRGGQFDPAVFRFRMRRRGAEQVHAARVGGRGRICLLHGSRQRVWILEPVIRREESDDRLVTQLPPDTREGVGDAGTGAARHRLFDQVRGPHPGGSRAVVLPVRPGHDREGLIGRNVEGDAIQRLGEQGLTADD